MCHSLQKVGGGSFGVGNFSLWFVDLWFKFKFKGCVFFQGQFRDFAGWSGRKHFFNLSIDYYRPGRAVTTNRYY